MTYYEADLKVEMKPESTKAFINRATVSFDHKPTDDEIKAELASRYPQVDLVEVIRVWDASGKAKWLSEYYGH
jgi:hypothetical protein